MSLASQLTTAFTRIGTEFKTVRSEILSKVGDLTTLTTTAKGSTVAAINEVKASISGAGAVINDTTPSTSTVYSATKTQTVANAAASAAATALIADASATTATATTYSANKINAAITAAITALINGAPGALDTLKEITDQLATDETAAAALTTAVGNRVRFDGTQTLTAPQQAQAQANMAVYSTTQVGDPTTDFAAAFTAALV